MDNPLKYFKHWFHSTASKYGATGLSTLIHKQNYTIAGGCIRDFYTKQKVSDVDFFFQNQEDFAQAKSTLEAGHVAQVYQNDNCIRYEAGQLKVDLVRSVFGTPQEIINQFDFTVCCAAVDHLGTTYFHDYFWQDLAAKHLRINNTPMPVGTARRMVKYIKKGFTPCAGTMIELSKALVALPEDTNFDQPFYFD